MKSKNLKLYLYKPSLSSPSIKALIISIITMFYCFGLDAFINVYCGMNDYTYYARSEFLENVTAPFLQISCVAIGISTMWVIIYAVRIRLRKETLNDRLSEVYFVNLDTTEFGCKTYDIKRLEGIILPMKIDGELSIYDIISMINNIHYLKKLSDIIKQDILGTDVKKMRIFKSYKILKKSKKSITIDTIDNNGVRKKIKITNNYSDYDELVEFIKSNERGFDF